MTGTNSEQESEWLSDRESLFKSYVPEIRQMARSQGDQVPEWSELNDQRHRFMADFPDGSDLLIFAYGSLLWKPLLRFSHQYHALLLNYHRRFCLDMTFLRGSQKTPGLMMALDKGGQCEGICYRIPAALVNEELHILWTRECCLSGYIPTWIEPDIQDLDTLLPCMTFIVNHDTPRYTDQLSKQQTVERIKTAVGQFGSNRDYFDNTLAHLRELNIHDAELESLNQALQLTQKE
ncbi:gamma-glutamylcyclotransferase [Endozoicomonas numazuensis]|uniref:gamma-glutamylcyclotransferase n=1 Tax=Endozoicomonas numazuensis TaxID=1137799 RepID=UPI00068FCD86|nr:gamma-glutamylcyclotransferase [Endozoicomonas numazuensis]